MNKLKKLAIAGATGLGLLVGGVGLSAPAQAVTGTTVEFNQLGPGVPATIDLYNTHMSGAETVQAFGTLKYHVKTTCPKNDNWKLAYFTEGASGLTYLKPGQCKTWQAAGRKYVGVFTADYRP